MSVMTSIKTYILYYSVFNVRFVFWFILYIHPPTTTPKIAKLGDPTVDPDIVVEYQILDTPKVRTTKI